ncbi:septation protein A [Granulosicoccaceae sp. 1_MG-2023]|nr:septation protein A [Granulosicoccaceae sp. 1_MG-2023]
MKFLYDYLPIALFFIAYKFGGIYTATGVAMLASLAQVGWGYWRHKRAEPMHLVSLGLIIVLGGLTLVLRDKAFIMYKPTLVNWLFGVAFLGSALIGSRPLIQRMLGSQIGLPERIWKRLNMMWVVFFLFTGAVNVAVVGHYKQAESALLTVVPDALSGHEGELECDTGYSGEALQLCELAATREARWVQFKLFGMLGMTFIFVIIQGFYLHRFVDSPDTPGNPAGDS